MTSSPSRARRADGPSRTPPGWALLYGSPVPGYHAPPERTVGVGTRVVGALFDAVAAGIATGDIRLTNDVAPQPMSSDFERIRQEFGFPATIRVVAKCFLLWAAVVGAISLEVFGQYGHDTLTDPGTVFDTQVRLLMDVLTRGTRAELERVHSAFPHRIRPSAAKISAAFLPTGSLGYPAKR